MQSEFMLWAYYRFNLLEVVKKFPQYISNNSIGNMSLIGSFENKMQILLLL